MQYPTRVLKLCVLCAEFRITCTLKHEIALTTDEDKCNMRMCDNYGSVMEAQSLLNYF